MNRSRNVELTVGAFMLAGLVALSVLALKVSGLSGFGGQSGYQVTANFDNIGGLKVRAPVTIAGVSVGEVSSIDLNETSFKAAVHMRIHSKQAKIPSDSSASILTQGLLGSNYIAIAPGFEEAPNVLANKGIISETHSAIILEKLIGQLVFNINKKK